ncbi:MULTISPECIES: zonular occludens toxin domain-containing protein [unclassified Herbaspirillum]|uniref:zonular occludens toxin domain-containing protein n=1 Tax=unclassified Herbaspirillum TaxID=2624150 RepID=UPI0011510557|nr:MULTISPECIES: zonular occludens toxin domain-containing protein [unclassified Herbaspirillum]MBB5391281.1 zona occludens toxin [Herbaspirillum sp. SJZ102]TQK13032.1 zona occludens toxin [Herbaspirillum sp. SJZ130]TQK15036.1 zona occludens toxin [Herbaspirillum sp. SJZ106]TWC67393.1 zona occludens toxin [Herbaspirillum sp. SJZ099]
MAITLVTGVPGSGKTLWAVSSLQKEVKAGRRVIVNGIRDLVIDHEPVDDDWIREWHRHCQPNDLIVIDEVQRIWPNVSSSVKPTEAIEQLHVHRHFGVDMIVITQHPNRMNKTIRDLVGHHVHVRRLFGGNRAMLYQWDHAHNPNSGLRDAVKTPWRYPKNVFDLYTSAELHTKPKAVIPKALFIIPIALVVAVTMAWQGFNSVSTGFGVVGGAGSLEAVSGASGGTGTGQAGTDKSKASGTWRVAGQYAIDGRGYVLLTDSQGRLRRESAQGFRGETLGVTGVVDGERVTTWTGAGKNAMEVGK